MIAMLLWVQVKDENHSIKFFIPLIIIYLLLIIIDALCLIPYLIMLLFEEKTIIARSYIKIMFKIPQLITAARGMEVTVNSEKEKIRFFVK